MVPDTSFMYILSILTMMKIYQTRHPDITASSYTVFGVLAFVIFLGMFGVLNNSPWFYIVFTVMHLWTCFFLTAQIYYMGLCKHGMYTFVVIWTYFSICIYQNLYPLIYYLRVLTKSLVTLSVNIRTIAGKYRWKALYCSRKYILKTSQWGFFKLTPTTGQQLLSERVSKCFHFTSFCLFLELICAQFVVTTMVLKNKRI